MRFLTSTLATTIAIGILAGCSGNMASPSAVVPSVSGQSPQGDLSQLSSRAQLGGLSPDVTQNLYVANKLNNTIRVYAEGTTTPLPLKINHATGGVTDPDSLAEDASQNLYVSNQGANDVTVYKVETNTPIRTLTTKIKGPTAVVVGSAGRPYVANSLNNSVTIYEQNSTTLFHQITDAVQNPQALALDHKGYLYVANGATSGSPNGSVSVYQDDTLLRVLSLPKVPINNPRALAVDASDNLYVANVGSGSFKGTVSVFNSAALGNTYLGSDTTNVSTPDALGINSNQLYVADTGTINEIDKFQLPVVNDWMQNIPNDPNCPKNPNAPPVALLFHSNGFMVVANYGAPGCVQTFNTLGSPYKTITQGIDGPVALVLGG
jgi:sugar lactone lactonase YvrE